MSRMLNLADTLLDRGRLFQEMGRYQDALTVFNRLTTFRELPNRVAEEAQVRLAEILWRGRQYQQARRHLTAVLSRQPENARYHALMAAILNEDPKADPHRAADHYRQSLRLQPHQPDCLSDFGLLALRLGQTEEGLACLRKAVELAPNDPEVVGKLVTGLRELDQTEEARQVLIAALFRNSWDARFRGLWNNFQYDQLSDRQQAARRAQEQPEGEEDRPAVLPFVAPPPSPTSAPQSAKRIRRDKPSPLPPPHIPGTARVSDRKHA